MNPLSVPRLRILLGVLLFWAVVVTFRLAQIQLFRHHDYVARAELQQERTIMLTPVRGSIRDAQGRILAESVTADSIYADPTAVVDWRNSAKLIAAVPGVGIPQKELERRLRTKSEFAWIARQLPPSIANSVRALNLPGIYTLEEHRRIYPKKTLAANLVGYTGIDGEGLAGIEHSFDTFVRGRAGKVTVLRDARRGTYVVGGEGPHAALDGNHVILTIDEVVQFVAERALRSAIEKYRAAAGSVIVMDPRDGSILAMVSYPTFDPNRYREAGPGMWRNRPVQDLYEPGSTFKIMTAAAGLEEGVVTPSQILDCGPGYIEIGRTRIHEHGENVYGMISFEEAMVHSSNVGAIRVGLGLGQQRLYDYVRKFGFGERSGIELPGEALGMLRGTRQWSMLSNAVISIGQEIGVTPLQMVLAVSAVANGGQKVAPRIVDRIIDSEGRIVHRPQPAPQGRVVSERTAAVLNEILKAIVVRGTGMQAALPDYVVAGKTGTAQKAGPGGYGNQVVASFAGYAPADRPRIAAIVILDEPHGQQYGGIVAAPVFREIAQATLRYLRVPPTVPDETLPVTTAKLASWSPAAGKSGAGSAEGTEGLDARAAVKRLTDRGVEVTIEGSGIVAATSEVPSGRGRARTRLVLRPASGAMR